MLEELPVYVKLKNSYNPAHYPANKKISAEEWNALWMSVMYQGNHQEDVLASILNVILPEHIVAINTVETKAIQALLNSEKALGIVNEAHEMSSQALDVANEANQTANEALTDINLKQNIVDEGLNTSDKTIVGAINEVKNSSVAVSDIINNLNSTEINKPLSANMGNTLREMIQGQEFGRSYNTIKDLVDALNIEGPDTFKVPFLFLIVDLDVPDFWVSEVMETSVPYEYTTDAALIAAVKTSPLQIGYYKISISETAKVDLTNYYTKTETNGLLDGKVDKVVGKGLSENDYTNEDKLKVDTIDTDGDGTKYLSDDGSYKEIPMSGGPFLKDPDKTYLVIKIPADNDTFTLLVGGEGTPNYTIDWGDGTSESITTTDNPSHEYEKAGMYLITISGAFENGIIVGVDPDVNKEKIIEVHGGTNYPTNIGEGAFENCISLTIANFPRVISIGVSAFYKCQNLTTADFPNVTSIGANAFHNCTKLTTANFLQATDIGGSAFSNCSSLTIANFPKVTSIGISAFSDCSSLTTVNFPNATSIGLSAFEDCTNLTIANFPNATSIEGFAFFRCTSLKELTLGNVTTTGTGTRFYNVELIDLNIAQDATDADIDRIKQFYADNGGVFIGAETKYSLQIEKPPTLDNDGVRKVDLDSVKNLIPTQINLYFTESTQTLFGKSFRVMQQDKPTDPIANIDTTITVTTQETAQVLARFTTIDGLSNEINLPPQNTEVNIQANKIAGSQNIRIFARSYLMDASGNETLLSVSNVATLTDVSVNHVLPLPIPAHTAPAGSRVVIEILSYRVSGSGTHTARLRVNDDTMSKWSYNLSLADLKLDAKNIIYNDTNVQDALDELKDEISGNGLGTKVYRDTQLLTSLDIKPIEDDIADNTTAIVALQNNKVDKVAGKQLSTEDFTTAEKNKLAGLNNYDDTQLKEDIDGINNKIYNLNYYKANKQDLSQDITANSVTAYTGNFTNINNKFSDYLKITDLLNKIYPIGSIYLSTNNVSPSSFIGGTWEQLPANKALWLVNANAGAEVQAGLPNITGSINNVWMATNFDSQPTWSGALQVGSQATDGSAGGNGWRMYLRQLNFNATSSNSIYGKSSTVQPPAYTIYGWRRIA